MKKDVEATFTGGVADGQVKVLRDVDEAPGVLAVHHADGSSMYELVNEVSGRAYYHEYSDH